MVESFFAGIMSVFRWDVNWFFIDFASNSQRTFDIELNEVSEIYLETSTN